MKAHLPSRRRHGFTLVEIVIVMTILVVLMGGAFFMGKGFIDDAKSQRVDSDLQNIQTALQAYERNNYFKVPTEEQGLKALVEMPVSDPKPQRWSQYFETVPMDPWGHEYQYRVPAKRSGKKYDLFTLGEDEIENENDIGNWK